MEFIKHEVKEILDWEKETGHKLILEEGHPYSNEFYAEIKFNCDYYCVTHDSIPWGNGGKFTGSSYDEAIINLCKKMSGREINFRDKSYNLTKNVVKIPYLVHTKSVVKEDNNAELIDNTKQVLKSYKRSGMEEHMMSMWREQLIKIEKCPQRQDSLEEQLNDLRVIANKFGFYDASDFLKQILNK